VREIEGNWVGSRPSRPRRVIVGAFPRTSLGTKAVERFRRGAAVGRAVTYAGLARAAEERFPRAVLRVV
jgi:hypothetical protein